VSDQFRGVTKMIDPTRAKNNLIFFFSKIKKEKIFETSKGKKPDEENQKRKQKNENNKQKQRNPAARNSYNHPIKKHLCDRRNLVFFNF
jgi:hypothetical protein